MYASFIGAQNISNITNKFGEGFKLVLMKSAALIVILELHKFALVDCCFGILSNLFVELGIDEGLV